MERPGDDDLTLARAGYLKLEPAHLHGLSEALDTSSQLLDQAMSVLDPTVVEVYYTDILEEIGELDADDEAGLRTKYFAQRDREIP